MINEDKKNQLADMAIDIYETIKKFEKSNEYKISCDLDNNLIQVKLNPKNATEYIECNVTIYKSGKCEIH